MTMKLIYCCLLAVAFHGYLAVAQDGKPMSPQKPSYPPQPQNPMPPPPPQYPQKPAYPPPPQNPLPPPPPPPPQYPQKPAYPPPPPQNPMPPPPPPPPQYPQKPAYPPPPPQNPLPPPPPPPPQYPQKPAYPPPPQNPLPPPPPPPPQYPQKPAYPPPPQNPPPPPPPQYPQKPAYPPPPQNPMPPPPPQYPQKPSNPPQPQIPQVPMQPTVPFHTCDVPPQYKIQCGPASITAQGCQAIDCCYDGQMCYYGKFVTLQCTKDGQFIIVVARDATLPYIDLESISFLGQGPNCSPVGTTSAFAIYQFPVTDCGTVMTDQPGAIIYDNKMTSSYEVAVGPYGAITRDSQYELHVQCKYIGTAVEALVIEVGVIPPPPPVAAPGILRVELRIGNGVCMVKGCDEDQEAYTSYYTDADYPVTKVLRDPVYVEVHILERTDPNIVLTLGRCWANTSPNPLVFPQWDLLIDGCPYHEDHYQTQLIPVGPSSGVLFPTHYRRFVFKMFTFVSGGVASDFTKKAPSDATWTPLQENVYIHCETAVCQPSFSNNCEPRCFRKKREISGSVKKQYREETTLISSNKIIFTKL
ncbi:zona pellucida sperm-binding protein 4-like [Nothobranchius furzeri]|uniref:Zona pellucida sperm-binding protein 4 n=1 Tax=Nothobranchius furzeri TaxID=105023 RepID=A0A9D2YQ43_NOTFU|nr:zona pellucida sperm-binding protein 4-like [Nothobranchius furzeri]